MEWKFEKDVVRLYALRATVDQLVRLVLTAGKARKLPQLHVPDAWYLELWAVRQDCTCPIQ
jgi:hypothetical protein